LKRHLLRTLKSFILSSNNKQTKERPLLIDKLPTELKQRLIEL
jgi:hypothetical protein